MPSHREHCDSPYRPEQLFDMVMDVEQYPEFLPWCRAARILETHEDHILAELVVSFKGLTESYVSRITPRPALTMPEISVDLVRGPFKTLTNHWRFEGHEDGGTRIHFFIEFQFKSRLLNALIGSLFTRAQEKMIRAFSARADALYGTQPATSSAG
jgi:coenzyme Q-binding protein COQ10